MKTERNNKKPQARLIVFDFNIADVLFETKGVECESCPNNCEIVCVFKNKQLIDMWGNKCDRGAAAVSQMANKD
ncbi:MAG: hypothetical protein LBN07_03815 [Christensenellaceae bacterium]|jgi:hypothetical protein|nr:hypothetical protein [Christensenellaceae bacterium]